MDSFLGPQGVSTWGDKTLCLNPLKVLPGPKNPPLGKNTFLYFGGPRGKTACFSPGAAVEKNFG